MGDMFPPPLKKLWNKWNIRAIIILSLFLQTILIFFAPSRRRTAKKLFLVLIWSVYLLADWAADYAVGQIADSQEEEAESNKHLKNPELLAFWSPFLLLHLGGPDTITALALEDNELWDRHLFSLVCQALATVYVILLSIPNRLLIPTLIMLAGGVIKYVERTAALFSASLDKLKDSMLQEPDPGGNYAKLMEEYEARRNMNMPTEVILVEDPEKGREGDTPVRPKGTLTPLQVVQYAYKYFNIFKGLIVDLIFTNKQPDESRKFFDSLSPEEALSIIEVELALIYDSLFTKAEILHNWTGVVFRFIALGCLVASLYLFRLTKKDQYHGFDVALTYALLICGIALDSIALLMFCVSDWTFARLRKLKEDLDEKDTWGDRFPWVDRVLNRILGFKSLRWKRSKCFKDGHEVLNRNFMFRRWSENVHAYNLIGYCLKIRPKRIHHTKGSIHNFFHKFSLDTAIDKATGGIMLCFEAVSESIMLCFEAISKRTRLFLDHLSIKNRVSRTVIKFLRSFLRFLRRLIYDNDILDVFGVKDLVREMRFTTSDRLTKELWEFILKQVQYKHRFAEDRETANGISSARGDWTLTSSTRYARLLKYVTEKDYDQSVFLWHIATELVYQTQIDEEIEEKEEHTNREFSKILSDYMMYLLIMQPTLMSAVLGFSKLRFRETCQEANEFFHRRHINKENHGNEEVVKKAVRAILSFNTERRKSMLYEASVLANELMRMKHGEESMWEVVSKVWVELLCYAATHCDSKQHASQLSKGGELINFVWLLMAHFGLGDQFQISKDVARDKLMVAM